MNQFPNTYITIFQTVLYIDLQYFQTRSTLPSRKVFDCFKLPLYSICRPQFAIILSQTDKSNIQNVGLGKVLLGNHKTIGKCG